MVYLSCDSIEKICKGANIDQSVFSPEFINGLKFSGIPNHKLVLKVSVPIMLLRNIDQSNGLCNGTRLQVVRFSRGYEANPCNSLYLCSKIRLDAGTVKAIENTHRIENNNNKKNVGSRIPVKICIDTFTEMVIKRIAHATMFTKSSLSSVSPKEGRKLANMVNKKHMLTTFPLKTSKLVVFRSTGSFIAIAISVIETVLRTKNLFGNQSFHCRNPLKALTAIARVEAKDAPATYNPTHDMTSSVVIIGFIPFPEEKINRLYLINLVYNT
ncbi:ATP-dependent DNA helicase PIF1-like protein [Tanacetum coccineum]